MSEAHSPTLNRKLHIHAQKSLKRPERDGSVEPREESALCRSHDHGETNHKGAGKSTAHLSELNPVSVWRLDSHPHSGGKYKYHWNAYELSKGEIVDDVGCGRAYKNRGSWIYSALEQLLSCFRWRRCQIYWVWVRLWRKLSKKEEGERSSSLGMGNANFYPHQTISTDIGRKFSQ